MYQVSLPDQEKKEGSRACPVMGGHGRFPLVSSHQFHVGAGGGDDDARAHGGVRACAHGPELAHDHARVSHLQRVHSCGGQGEYPGLVCGCGLCHGEHGHGHGHGCAHESVHGRGLYHGPHCAHGCGGALDLYCDHGCAYHHAGDHVCGHQHDHGHA